MAATGRVSGRRGRRNGSCSRLVSIAHNGPIRGTHTDGPVPIWVRHGWTGERDELRFSLDSPGFSIGWHSREAISAIPRSYLVLTGDADIVLGTPRSYNRGRDRVCHKSVNNLWFEPMEVTDVLPPRSRMNNTGSVPPHPIRPSTVPIERYCDWLSVYYRDAKNTIYRSWPALQVTGTIDQRPA